MKDAQKDIEFKVKDADEFEGKQDDDDPNQAMILKVKGMEGAKQVSMNTNALESKINAIQIIKTLARNLGTAFYDYVEDVAMLCIGKLLNDPYSFTLRKESAKCMRFLIGACKDYPEKQKALFIMAYAKEMEELEKRIKRTEFDQTNGILKEINKQLKNFLGFKEKGLTVFSQEDATTLVNKLHMVVETIKLDKTERYAKIKKMGKHIDEEDMAYFEENLEDVDKGIHHAMEINGFLMQNMGEQISGVVGQTLLPSFAMQLLDISSKKDYELVVSVCFICDCMEHGNSALFDQIKGQAGTKFVELITYATKDKSELKYDILQSCIFGLGVIAQRSPLGQFKEFEVTVAILKEICNGNLLKETSEDD